MAPVLGPAALRTGFDALDQAFGEASLAVGAMPDGLNLRRVFDDATQRVFPDLTHTNEQGAEIVAAAIFAALQPELRRRAGLRGSPGG
jgi:hypothetical protein